MITMCNGNDIDMEHPLPLETATSTALEPLPAASASGASSAAASPTMETVAAVAKGPLHDDQREASTSTSTRAGGPNDEEEDHGNCRDDIDAFARTVAAVEACHTAIPSPRSNGRRHSNEKSVYDSNYEGGCSSLDGCDDSSSSLDCEGGGVKVDPPPSRLAIGGVRRRGRGRGRGRGSHDDVDGGNGSNRGDGAGGQHRVFRKETRAVACLRILVLSMLLVATVLVASLTYHYMSTEEVDDFRNHFRDDVVKVAEQVQNRLDSMVYVARTFSATFTSRYGGGSYHGGRWPNATMPDFQEQAAGQLKLATGRALSFNPIITSENRAEWEAHAVQKAHILGAEQLVNRSGGDDDTTSHHRIVADGIYRRGPDGSPMDDPGLVENSRYPDVMVPVWQIAPIRTNERAVMFNLRSVPNRERALDDMLQYQVPTLTSLLQLVQDGPDPRPSSILFYPVFADFFTSVPAKNGGGGGEGGVRTVVGSISIVFSWDVILSQILPHYIRGIICVLEEVPEDEDEDADIHHSPSRPGRSFTYRVEGGTSTLLGPGDLHDHAYDSMAFEANTSLDYGGVAVDDPGGDDGGNRKHLRRRRRMEEASSTDHPDVVRYRLRIYPSAEFETQYVTNTPIVYTAVVILIFVCTSALFLTYDYLVEHRQNMVMEASARSSRIVDSLFPAVVRDRLFRSEEEREDKNRRRSSRRKRRRYRHRSSLSVSSSMENSGGNGRRRRASSVAERVGAAGDAEEGQRQVDGSRGSHSINGSTTGGGGGGGLATVAVKTMAKKFIPNKFKETPAVTRIRNFMNLPPPNPSDAGAADEMVGDYDLSADLDVEEPIADHFPDTTICFMDIVGFTAWGSEREPTEVFHLLETLYREFDLCAKKWGVFKVETVGDCYVAVIGLPDPREDHALIMCRFAFECRQKMGEVARRLVPALGEATAGLTLRCGLHSGPVTGGVLRGEKSRFQLFGDTMNTASRMESTGSKNRIQVSGETASLLTAAGKGHWLVPREGLVHAKGKGKLQTYWLSRRKERKPPTEDVAARGKSLRRRSWGAVTEFVARRRSSFNLIGAAATAAAAAEVDEVVLVVDKVGENAVGEQAKSRTFTGSSQATQSFSSSGSHSFKA